MELEKSLNEYLEKIEKYLKPLIVSERVDIVKEIKSEMLEWRLVILNAKEQIPRRMTGTRSIAFIFLPSTELKHNRNGVKWCGSTDT